MKCTLQNYTVLFFSALLLFVVGILIAHASIIARQDISTNLSNDRNGAQIIQTIGNGYTHIPTTLSVKIKKSSVNSSALYGFVACWNEATYTTICNDQPDWRLGFFLQSDNTIATTSTNPITLTFTFNRSITDPIALRPNKYYKIGVGTLSGNNANDAYGSATDVFPSGAASNASPLKDIYFLLEGDIPDPVVEPPLDPGASSIADQSVSENLSLGTSNFRQGIGGGFNQTPTRLTFRIRKQNGNQTNVSALLLCYNDAAYTSTCSDQPGWTFGWIYVEQDYVVSGRGNHFLSIPLTSPGALRSDKYYKVVLICRTGNCDWRTYGSTADVYAFGAAEGGASSLADVYFRLEGIAPEVPPVNPDPVIIIPGILGSSDKNGAWVIDPIFHTYDDLIATLAANGYTKEKDLFTFPYDWRKSNVLTALELRDKIDEVQEICACEKVDLVAHSMGGLVARHYIQSDKYEDDVDQLIFLGTPHLGAPKAYLMWEGGTSMGGDFIDRTLDYIFLKEAEKAGFTSLFDYIRNKPLLSMQELLPTYDYLFDNGEARDYPSNYPRNIFLENLRTSVDLLTNSGVRVANIIGDAGPASTRVFFDVIGSDLPLLWEHGKPININFGFGDGTVPFNSASYIQEDLATTTFSHNFLPTGAEGLIFKKLTGKVASTTFNTNSIFKADYKLLLIKLLSPIDILVIAPDGKRIGKDFQTGNEFNEIEGAFYSGFLTDDEYITIPNPLDGEYKVLLQGTGTGEYTVATAYISDTDSAEKDFTAQTLPGLESELRLLVSSSDPEALDIVPTDTTPPYIVVSSPEPKDYQRSETLPVLLAIQDTESGVLSSTVMFDDRIITSTSTIDLFFEKLGDHALHVSATDLLGNATSTTVSFRVVATLESTIADIERAYSLGWITKKHVKDTLIKKFNTAIRLERKIEILEEKLPGKPAVTKRIERMEKRLDKILGTALLKELEREHPRSINEQALELLEEDIIWLLNN